jgi:hypothetical protein
MAVEVANPAGRLITFRVVPPVEDGNSAAAANELRAAIAAVGGPVVVCADITAGRTFSPETTARFVALMRSDNPTLARSALLFGTSSATLGLQIERMVREAEHPGRRTFSDRGELRAWLAEELTAAECGALDAFLATSAG